MSHSPSPLAHKSNQDTDDQTMSIALCFDKQTPRSLFVGNFLRGKGLLDFGRFEHYERVVDDAVRVVFGEDSNRFFLAAL